MEEALFELPLLDVHTHLDATHLAARGLGDLLLYHMVISDLYSAGCPDGGRLSEWPDEAEARGRILRALPFVERIENTSCYWGLRILLGDLYDWHEPIRSDNWERLDGAIRERSGEADWPGEVLDRGGIRRSVTELWRRHDGRADGLLQYSLEWAFFARCQWGEYDTALYELEQTWSQDAPSPPLPVTMGEDRPALARTVRTLEDVREAVDHYVACIPFEAILSTAQHLSTDLDYRLVSDEEMAAALKRRDRAGAAERDVYAGYILDLFLRRLGERPEPFVFQFSLGAEPLPYETGSRLSHRTLAQLGELVARHPRVSFHCYSSSAHANQTLCTLARELPNFVLAGYWWHSFFPPFIRRAMDERLDMLAVSRQIGFFSDAYCVEWSYAKAVLVRKMLAQVLARKVSMGQYDRETAIRVARAILFETPQALVGIAPREERVRRL
ncbi:MAG: hypothetical protein JXQ73_29895 [Phycisphaerae bacterium]|nr:hypothetical protein [Phycisphaerae bacterium]